MTITATEFVAALRAVGLISESDSLALATHAEQNLEELARLLVRNGKLTGYQASVTLQGRADTLVLGNYVVLDRIGAGGMGQVFRARHRRMERTVALKVLSQKSLASSDAVARFQREVLASAKLVHPNIVTAYDADEAGGTHFMVMEFVPGSDLAGLVKRKGPFSVEQALDCILQTARGLHKAHCEGVIHRDIKPSNLLLSEDGVVKILDMGLARISAPLSDPNAAPAPDLTHSGSIMGTVDYMAPEQAMDCRQADARSDIYALGCTLYYLLTGRPPFSGDTVMKRLTAHQQGAIPLLSSNRENVPATVQRIFSRMVAKRPAARYQSTAELIVALESLDQDQLPARASTSSSAASLALAPMNELESMQTPTAETRPRHRKQSGSRIPVVAALVVLSMVIVAVGGWYVSGRKADIKPQNPPAAANAVEASAVELLPATKTAVPMVGSQAEVVKPPTALAEAKPTRQSEAPQPDSKPLQPDPAPAAPPSTQPMPATSPNAPPVAGVVLPPTPAVAADGRLTVPTPEARDAALEVIKQIFISEYAAAKNADGKAELIKKLLAQADSTRDDPAARFVLICEARDLAADVLDIETLDKTVDKLGSLYQIEPLSMQLEIYQKLTTKSRTPAGNKALAEGAMALAKRAIAAENLDVAESLLKIAGIAAGKAHAADLVKLTREQSAAVVEAKHQSEALARAEATLKENPEDATANLTLGKYRCFVESDWERGLTHLMKGSDAGLKQLAAKCLPIPTDAAAQAAAGDAWWDASLSRKGKEADAFQAAARYWYSASLPGLTGIVKTKVEKRLLDAPASPGQKRNAAAKQLANAEIVEFPLAPSVSLKLRLISPGKFNMGSPASEPGRAPTELQHEVTISNPFYLGVTELTQAQWLAVMGSNPSKQQGDPTRPVEFVTPTDIQSFLANLNQSPLGQAYVFRLPSEAEWEYSCRAGTTTAYYFGNDVASLKEYGWFADNSAGVTQPVAKLKSNAWGLYDMHGNVWEYCSDWVDTAYYQKSPAVDPRGPDDGSAHINRGGSIAMPASRLRSATRGGDEIKHGTYGFRLACQPIRGRK